MKQNKCKKQPIANCTIGGQALLEGVMMRGKTSMALAVRGESGDVLLETQRLKPKSKAARFPILRGVISFGSALVTGVSVTLRAAEAVTGEDEKLSKGAEVFAVILGLALAIGLFFFLPAVLSGLFNDKVYDNILIKNLVSGVLRVGIFILYLFAVSLLKDIRRTYMYHGAEHRTINCFEKGMPLTVENVQKCSTRHNRCGTTFMFLVMVISIFVFALADYGFSLLIPMQEGIARKAIFMGLKLLLLPLVAGLSYEVLFLFAKLPDNLFARIVRAPGLALQRLTTKPPDDDMAAVAIAGFNAVLEMENNPDKPAVKFNQIDIEAVKSLIDERLSELNAEPAEGDWLLCAVTGKRRSELNGLKQLTQKEFKRLKELLEKRKEMPLDYCLETSCFYGRDVTVDKRVLIPRMETEILCEVAIKAICEDMNNAKEKENKAMGENAADEGRNISVLDLCTGSGCIAMTIAKETAAKGIRAIVTAADISADALKVAEENLKDTGAELVLSDMFSGLNGRAFDMIVCNPPYIRSKDIQLLQSEVRCQPHIALDGGEDGLDFYRILAANASDYLHKGGYLVLEAGFDQAAQIKELLLSGGFDRIEIIKDLEGIDRVIRATLAAEGKA